MKLKDNYIWEEFTKLITKIDNKNRIYIRSTRHTNIIIHKVEPQLFLQNGDKNKVKFMDKHEKKTFKEEFTIDLHGLTKSNVNSVLEDFCKNCIVKNIRNVVIITGKGEGIIRKNTEEWLKSSSNYVISFSPILDSAKQFGAYAVRLRKNKIK